VSPSWTTLLFEAANFLVLAAVLGWAFFRPVRGAIEQRRAKLEAEEREAAEALAAAKRATAEAAAGRSEFERSLAALRKSVREESERERQALLDAAREQAQRERDALEGELAALRRGQAARLASDAAVAAREIVERLLERIEGPDLEQALAKAARDELVKLAAAGSVAPVIVESAEKLPPTVLEPLAAAADIDVSELGTRVVPDLGAGIRIVTARGLIDASSAGLAAYAERALTSRLDAPEVGHD
jgi:F-type H+-transporting ATPase subunit b